MNQVDENQGSGRKKPLTCLQPKTVIAAVLACVLGMIVPAQGEVMIFSTATFDWVLTAEELENSPEELISLTLGVINRESDKSNKDPKVIDITVTGMLHQQGIPTLADNTSTLDDADFAKNIDTHFLVSASQILSLDPPFEDQGTADTSDEPTNATGGFASFAESSFGTFISGTIAAQSSVFDPGSRWDFLYLVVPNNSMVSIEATVTSRDGLIIEEEANFPITAVVPEPGTAIVLLLGALAMASRRRVA